MWAGTSSARRREGNDGIGTAQLALDKDGSQVDAVICAGGKPYKSVSQFKDDRFHLVPVEYAKPLQGDYLPATLTAKDYPNLIADGEQVDTIAVPAVLAAYNWAPNTERYRKLALFVWPRYQAYWEGTAPAPK